MDMQGTERPTFWPTPHLWPGTEAEIPTVRAISLRSEGALVSWSTTGKKRDLSLPPDFVLREVVDSGAKDVLDFMASWGPLVRPGGDYDGLSEVDRPTFEGADYDAAVVDGLVVRSRFLYDAAAYRLRLLRTLALHTIATDERDHVGVYAAWMDAGFVRPPSIFDANMMWADHVNAALRAFPIYVDIDVPGGADNVAGLQLPSRTTYEVAVLQLAHIATGGRKIQRCLECGNAFTRQRTDRRAYKNSEHSSGVSYCDRRCAKRKSERERRARVKKEGKS